MMINKVILVGHVGKDPELKRTNSGAEVATFSLATNEKYKGEQKTEWHKIVCWNKLAEVVSKYVKKGRQLYVEGKIETSNYEKNGQKHYITEIIAKEVKFFGGATNEFDQRPQYEFNQQPPNQSPSIDDLPF